LAVLPEFRTSDFNDRVALSNTKKGRKKRGVDPAHVSLGSLCLRRLHD
jgi:hypothetical protein